MRRLLVVLAIFGLMAAMAPPVSASQGVEKEPIVRTFDEDGSPSGEVAGRSHLIRRADSLKASVQVDGLTPGGVYTFWWIVIQGAGEFPGEWFVANGAAVIAGSNGKATVHMTAEVGDESIVGFVPAEELGGNGPLVDTLASEVHVEIAYHGQIEDAGDQLDAWLDDFWTGTACPNTFGNNPQGAMNPPFTAAGQPHCPVYVLAVHN